MNTRALLLSGLIAGVLMALFSELPIISILNCCLCLWIWVGGIFAVFLYRRFDNSVGPTTLTQGVLVGLVAGLVSAVLGTILAAIIGPISWQFLSRALDLVQGSGTDLGSITGLLESRSGFSFFELITNLVFYSFFGVVGGMLGTLIFKGGQSSPITPSTPSSPITPA
jgi:hypothetical protein